MKKDSCRKIHLCCPARIEDSGYSRGLGMHKVSCRTKARWKLLSVLHRKLMCTGDIQYVQGGGTSEKVKEKGDPQFAAPLFLSW